MSEQMAAEVILNPDHFPPDQRRIVEIIERVRGHGGEAYEGSTDLARRNPVKPDTAPILTAYANMYLPKRVFEMGTAYGFSALHIGLGCRVSQIDTVEFDDAVAQEAQDTLREAGLKAMVFPGTVQQGIAFLPEDARYDMVFIDHDKKSYLPDFLAIEPFLNPGCIVLGDNVNDRRAETADFVEYMQNEYGATIMPTQAGLLVATV